MTLSPPSPPLPRPTLKRERHQRETLYCERGERGGGETFFEDGGTTAQKELSSSFRRRKEMEKGERDAEA